MASSCGDMLSLPEGCIAKVLSFTTPRDACRLSVVSSMFKNASRSDTVWERFLPPDYQSIISRSSDPSLLMGNSKKQLFLSLCERPILIDEGKKSFALEKRSGKKCYMISARELVIVWADTPRYWTWNSDPDSRFDEVAELIDVCWLEIRGRISTHMLSPATNYCAFLVFKLKTGAYGLHNAEATVGISGSGESSKCHVCFDSNSGTERRIGWGRFRGSLWSTYLGDGNSNSEGGSGADGNRYPKERGDEWLWVELGEFYNENGKDGEVLEVSVVEVKSGRWKRGLIVQGIEIRPK